MMKYRVKKKVMDTTTLYYAFSTIAQTLAAGFGVLGAFVLFRLQGVEKNLEEAKSYFKMYLPFASFGEDIRKPLMDGGYEAFDKHMCELSERRYEAGMGRFYTKDQYKDEAVLVLENWPIWNSTKKRLLSALIVTVFDIVLSLILIPFAPALSRCPAYALAALAISIVAAGVALQMYAVLIWYLFNPSSSR